MFISFAISSNSSHEKFTSCWLVKANQPTVEKILDLAPPFRWISWSSNYTHKRDEVKVRCISLTTDGAIVSEICNQYTLTPLAKLACAKDHAHFPLPSFDGEWFFKNLDFWNNKKKFLLWQAPSHLSTRFGSPSLDGVDGRSVNPNHNWLMHHHCVNGGNHLEWQLWRVLGYQISLTRWLLMRKLCLPLCLSLFA